MSEGGGAQVQVLGCQFSAVLRDYLHSELTSMRTYLPYNEDKGIQGKILTSKLITDVTLSKSLSFPAPQFPHLCNGTLRTSPSGASGFIDV